jgi:hypothetical protein
MNTNQRVFRGKLAAAAAALVMSACADGDGGQERSGAGEPLGSARIALERVPQDVLCIRLDASRDGQASKLYDVQPGDGSVFELRGLPTGSVVFTADAYGTACGAVHNSSVPLWISEAVSADVRPGAPVDVTLRMLRNVSGQVHLDFPGEAAECGEPKAPCTQNTECCSNRCDLTAGDRPGLGACSSLAVLNGPLVTLPQTVKQRDFRTLPPKVEEISATQAPGGTLLRVRFEKDERVRRQVVLSPDADERLVLSDTGEGGDERAGDGVFSVLLDVPFGRVAQEHRRMLEVFRRLQIDSVPVFRGRELIGQLPIDFGSDILRFPPILPPIVDPNRSLLITAPSVVEDPTRTFNPCTNVGNPNGVWTFNHVMTEMANQPVSGTHPSDLTLDWLKRWVTVQTANGLNVPARTAMNAILAAWPKLGDGRLNLARAPFKLLAVVNRIDLAGNVSYGRVSGAEGRLVFELLDSTCNPTRFLVIFEYGVPKTTCTEMKSWANQWLALGSLALGSPAYNTALANITEQFVKRNSDLTKPNGSALNQVRTNETALAGPWELREFNLKHLPLSAALLHLVTVKQTPDDDFNQQVGGTRGLDLAQYVNTNQAAILAGAHTVPNLLPFPPNDSFMAASIFSLPNFWNAAGILNNDARHGLSLNTCDGCHGSETATPFAHVDSAPFGSPAPLSGFLTGITIPDPVSAVPRSFNDLASRGSRLTAFATASCSVRGFPTRLDAAFAIPLPPIQVKPVLASH